MTTYEEFLTWAEAQGLEFPYTAGEFFSRAISFTDGNQELVEELCEEGIGSNWKEA